MKMTKPSSETELKNGNTTNDGEQFLHFGVFDKCLNQNERITEKHRRQQTNLGKNNILNVYIILSHSRCLCELADEQIHSLRSDNHRLFADLQFEKLANPIHYLDTVIKLEIHQSSPFLAIILESQIDDVIAGFEVSPFPRVFVYELI